jgi:hypothetical protein
MDSPRLTITEIWHGYDRDAVIVTVRDGHEHAGT